MTQTQRLVNYIKDYAERHYEEDGWDFIVECYSDAEIADIIGDALTTSTAVARVLAVLSVYEDRRLDAINSAF